MTQIVCKFQMLWWWNLWKKKWKPHEALFIRFSYEIDVKVLLSTPQFSIFGTKFFQTFFFRLGNRSIGRTYMLHSSTTWINHNISINCFFFVSYSQSQPASYGKKNGMWYASPGNQGWGNKSANRNPSVLDADITASAPNVLKPSAGRVIRIINNLDHNVQVIICATCIKLARKRDRERQLS